MNLEEIVNQKYDVLTANDREMLNSIFTEQKQVNGMNSTELASFLHVSRTTLVRLMKKLGIATYVEFRLLLNRKEETQAVTAFRLQDVEKEYHLMIDELKKHSYENTCSAIYRAGTIYLYGTGNEQKTIAEEFKRIFLTMGKCCVDLFDLGEIRFARERFQEEDLFIAISLSGENRDAVEAVQSAQRAGVRTLSLTRWASNTLARACQENLYVGTKTVSHTSGQSYEMVAMFYILLDILSVRYLEYVEKCREEPNL